MKTELQWQARAREIWIESMSLERREGLLPPELCAMLRLGREMADEARKECDGDDWRAAVKSAETRAADRRAEEIAEKLEEFAQEQRERADANQRACLPLEGKVVAATAFTIAAEHARSTMQPKTREQVLEEALRIARSVVGQHGLDWTCRKIDEALEWNP